MSENVVRLIGGPLPSTPRSESGLSDGDDQASNNCVSLGGAGVSDVGLRQLDQEFHTRHLDSRIHNDDHDPTGDHDRGWGARNARRRDRGLDGRSGSPLRRGVRQGHDVTRCRIALLDTSSQPLRRDDLRGWADLLRVHDLAARPALCQWVGRGRQRPYGYGAGRVERAALVAATRSMEQLVTSSRERTGPRPSGVTCCPTR